MLKRNQKAAIKMLFIGLTLIVTMTEESLWAQSKQNQLQCRTKAKEIAKTAYTQCLSLATEDEAENLRKEYRLKIAKLKEFYEQKIKRLNLKPKSETSLPLPQKNTQTALSSPQPNELKETTLNTQSAQNTQSTYAPPPPVPAPEASGMNQNGTSSSTTTETAPNEYNEPTIRLKEAPYSPPSSERLDSGSELSI